MASHVSNMLGFDLTLSYGGQSYELRRSSIISVPLSTRITVSPPGRYTMLTTLANAPLDPVPSTIDGGWRTLSIMAAYVFVSETTDSGGPGDGPTSCINHAMTKSLRCIRTDEPVIGINGPHVYVTSASGGIPLAVKLVNPTNRMLIHGRSGNDAFSVSYLVSIHDGSYMIEELVSYTTPNLSVSPSIYEGSIFTLASNVSVM